MIGKYKGIWARYVAYMCDGRRYYASRTSSMYYICGVNASFIERIHYMLKFIEPRYDKNAKERKSLWNLLNCHTTVYRITKHKNATKVNCVFSETPWKLKSTRNANLRSSSATADRNHICWEALEICKICYFRLVKMGKKNIKTIFIRCMKRYFYLVALKRAPFTCAKSEKLVENP